jgi:hypothetical protein
MAPRHCENKSPPLRPVHRRAAKRMAAFLAPAAVAALRAPRSMTRISDAGSLARVDDESTRRERDAARHAHRAHDRLSIARFGFTSTTATSRSVWISVFGRIRHKRRKRAVPPTARAFCTSLQTAPMSSSCAVRYITAALGADKRPQFCSWTWRSTWQTLQPGDNQKMDARRCQQDMISTTKPLSTQM